MLKKVKKGRMSEVRPARYSRNQQEGMGMGKSQKVEERFRSTACLRRVKMGRMGEVHPARYLRNQQKGVGRKNTARG